MMSDTTGDGPSLSGRLAALQTRLDVVESIQSIINLKARYLTAIDGGWDGPTDLSDAVGLFVPDGVWDVEGIGGARGHDDIRSLFGRFARTVPFGFHSVTNPKIEVSGDTATGEWHLVAFVTSRGDLGEESKGSGELFAATIYFDEFVRVDGEWKIASVREKIVFFQPFKDGWTKATSLAR